MTTTSRPAEIIAFYSFKEGAGRTMALANAAWIMASHGKSVLVIDWDLEAPGLHLYYHEYLPVPDLRFGAGILDMFCAFADAATSDEDGIPEDLSGLYDEHANFERYRVGVNYPFPEGGRLDYIGPGRMDDGYAERLRGFDWGTFQASDDGREFLEALRARMHDSDYDYILIDSRTSFSDGAGICTLALPDSVVVGLAMNRQAIEGAGRMAQRISDYHRPIRLHMLPMRIDFSEEERRARSIKEARRVLDRFLDIRGEDQLDAYWGEVQIPYKPYFAFGEELAVMVENPRQKISVLAQYVKAVARVTDGAVDGFEPVSDAQRNWYYERLFNTGRSTEVRTVALLHAPDDQMWADWIGEQLRPARIQVIHRRPDGQDPDSLPDSDYLLVLLSPQLQGTPVGRTVERLSTGAPVSSDRERRVVGLRVSGARLAPQFDWLDAASLAGLSEEAARRALLARFGIRTRDEALLIPSAGPRFPGRQPDVWKIPVRNSAFTGRVAQLDALRESFRSGVADRPAPQVLWGMKGVGKKQIAVEYAHRFAAEYDLVWWIPASDPEAVRVSLAELARAVNRNSDGARTGEEWDVLLEDLRLEKYCPRWLLIFDDAENQESVEPYIPSGGAGHVLITSRNPGWPHFDLRHVDVFTPAESLTLLSRKLPGASDAELSRLAERLGQLPLIEEAAAAWLAVAPESVDEYIALLDSGTPLSAEGFPEEYQKFAAVYRLAYEKLLGGSPAAARLLDLCVFMSPDGVGLKVIQSKVMRDLLAERDERLRDSILLRTLLNELSVQALAVVDQSARKLKVHRVVQDLVRGWMSPEEQALTRAQALSVLASMAPSDLERDEPGHRQTFAELDQHVVVSGALDSDDPAVHAWLVNQVRYRWFWEQWSDARELGTRILLKWRARLGSEHMAVLRLESQVGAACRMLGRYEEALSHSKHAVMAQRALSSHHTYALLAGRGYAADLRAMGDFDGAFDEDRRSYFGLCDAIGVDHTETLNASANLALSKFYMESVEAAVRQGQSTFETRRRALGERNHQTWRSYADLGTFHREAGQLDISEEHLLEARNRLRDLLADDHYLTLWALQSLGMTMVRQGRAGHGLELLQDAHSGFQRQWSDGHPRTMSSRLAVAAGLHAAGRPGDAAGYAEEVLDHYVELFGADHPFTGICRSNLALYLLDIDDRDNASDHAKKAAHQLKSALGREHRYTLVARMNQNNCLEALGQVSRQELITEDEEILKGCELSSAWGPRHAITLTAMANLAGSRTRDNAELLATVKRRAAEFFDEGHRLAGALVAQPYRRLGADLEVLDV
ncbi:FxSxx-COOH system tetratricopeptide repeat protein [Streptomyces sp. AK02-01A]|uniref:FxSxx-COOH system tetratricopeptide repeat protein n=1 Tax=Streptomyces sp. AK02-01A TaxID=3028648 RepID=UPI0029B9E491|nr:FxSxx-COOH system tetratricopeptide repeat protein [Streptomyces sp. AK02-01A]MDX3850531.1 FxSxx-COOH system tetratricopeptide repeat protein [Streptomyces sp. AK02-01A]